MTTASVKEFQLAIYHLYPTHWFKEKQENLNCVLVSFQENAVVFTAADSKGNIVRIKIKCWEKLDQEYYSVLIPYYSLARVRDRPRGHFLKITCEGLNLKLEGNNINDVVEGVENDFPHIDEFDDSRMPRGEVTINRWDFSECVKTCRVYAYQGKNLSQPLLEGIHLAIIKDTARAEATDGQILLRVTFPVVSQHKFEFVVPSDLPQRFLTQAWDKITIRVYGDRIVATDDTGRVEFQGTAIPEGIHSYPSCTLDSTIGKTVASTVMSSRIDPYELVRFLDKIEKSNFVTFVCEGRNLHVHGLDSQPPEQICFRRSLDGDGEIAWASVSRKMLALMCAEIPVTVKEVIFHLSTNPTEKLAVVIAYSNDKFSFIAAIGQLPCSEDSLTRKREKELLGAYFTEPAPPEAAEDDSDNGIFSVPDDFFPDGFFD